MPLPQFAQQCLDWAMTVRNKSKRLPYYTQNKNVKKHGPHEAWRVISRPACESGKIIGQ